MKNIIYQHSVPVRREVDVAVIGGGPAGMAAAVTAARLGQLFSWWKVRVRSEVWERPVDFHSSAGPLMEKISFPPDSVKRSTIDSGTAAALDTGWFGMSIRKKLADSFTIRRS